MPAAVDLYDSHYANLSTDLQSQVRRETYGDDLGQTSWINVAEAREHLQRLGLAPGADLLEVACGSGGLACLAARETGARCVGIDVNAGAVEAATVRARGLGLSERVSFRAADAARPLPFDDGSFDAVFCNDSINHFPGRAAVLGEWRRVLRPGGRALYTDPIVVTGQLSNEEVRVRSSIGFFLFTPVGANERLLAEAGFEVIEVRDLTAAVAAVSRRWRDALARRREALVARSRGRRCSTSPRLSSTRRMRWPRKTGCRGSPISLGHAEPPWNPRPPPAVLSSDRDSARVASLGR